MRNKILSVYNYYVIVIIFLLVSFFKELQANLRFRHIGLDDMTELEARSHAMQYYTKFKSRLLLDQEKEMKEQKIKINDLEMKFHMKKNGIKPPDGWDLYFSLHGGGGTHHSINEDQWVRHQTLYQIKNGILLTPRSPTNTWNMWHQEHIDIFFDTLIKNLVAFHNVNPNRVYLMGYSAGGDGVYQISPRMADRFAAAAMMAGHPNETIPLGLRNIGFTIHMGAEDSSYNRNKVAQDWRNKLEILNNNDTAGYQHLVKIYPEKGHWMEREDSSAISWMRQFSRDPFPDKIVWKQDDVTKNRFYWLRVQEPTAGDLIIVSLNGQKVVIEESTSSRISIMFNDDMVDMDKDIMIEYGERVIFNGNVHRNVSVIERTIEEYGDPKSVYFGEISLLLDS